MNKATYQKIFSEAVSYALKRRLSLEQAEDFAQRFILSRYILRTDQKINQAFVDYLRHEYGDSRGTGLKRIARHYLELNEEICGQYEISEELISWQLVFERLSARQRQIVRMRLWGFGLREIGEFFGITPARVLQILRDVK